MSEFIMWGDQCLTYSGALWLFTKIIACACLFFFGFVIGAMR